MRVVVAVIGRARAAGVAEAIRTYEERAGRYWPLDVHEVREEGGRSLPAEEVRRREGFRLAERTAGAHLVLCEEDGERWTSRVFAERLQRWREGATDVAFVIGGAHGLSPALRPGAAVRLSLAPWTLPHELARLVLVEQLYRAGTILRGEPYHK